MRCFTRDRHLALLSFVLFGLTVVVLWGCKPRARVNTPTARSTSALPVELTVDATIDEVVANEIVIEEPIAEKTPAETPAAEEAVIEEASVAEEAPAAEGTDTEEATAEEADLNPSDTPTPVWLPSPLGVSESAATTEAAMKPYTEKIAGTDVTFDMVAIRSGKFMMGSPADESDRGNDEGPQCEVVIEPFWMGKCEVTWDEYLQWAEKLERDSRDLAGKREPTEHEKLADAITRPTNAYVEMTFNMGKDGYPAICMTQLSAEMYCKWLSAKTGRYYRLPTEAEWEYACRAGTTTAYSFGDDPDDLDAYAWYFDNSEDGYAKVGQKKPNPWGLHDMHGNVSEWCLDQYFADFYARSEGKTITRPFASPTTEYPRVARGGCWDHDANMLRSAARIPSSKDWKMQDPQLPKSIWYNTESICPGFRVVRPLQVPGADEAKRYEPDTEVMHEYRAAQAGKE